MRKNEAQLIPGLRLGHYTDARAKTGCTVLVCERGAVAGVDIRGSASGTREIAVCQPGHLVDRIHAVMISGGSAFGLAAADGAMEYLEQSGVGFDVGVTRVPIVASAILYDLGVGSPWIRPDRQAGYSACASARENPVQQGRVGAGTGATVGKLFGVERASPGGFGFASLSFPAWVSPSGKKSPAKHSIRSKPRREQITVQAFAVVNAFGDVVDPKRGKIIAGARNAPQSKKFVDTVAQMKQGLFRQEFNVEAAAREKRWPMDRSAMTGSARASRRRIAKQMPAAVKKMFALEGADTGSRYNAQNTTIVVVATDAAFDKVQMQKVAQMAQNGLARVLRPAHTMFDGDTVFALSVAEEHHPKRADVNVVGEVAAEAVAEAVLRAVKQR
jgi:L-aminopeptidase/D-esterase-like protein